MSEEKRSRPAKQDKNKVLEHHLYGFMGVTLWVLNEKLDRRLVSTFFGLVMAIIMHRHRNHGLLSSELGGYLLGPERCWGDVQECGQLAHLVITQALRDS